MQTQWIALHDIPAEGREFSFHDQTVWETLWTDFGVECRAVTPVSVKFTVLPAANGIFVQGTIHGKVILPCSRCLEDVSLNLENDFDFFDPLPVGNDDPKDGLLREENGVMEFDIIALVWEQFIIIMPDKIVCSPSCKGLCPQCGENLNTGICICTEETGDIRLSALRNLKVSKK